MTNYGDYSQHEIKMSEGKETPSVKKKPKTKQPNCVLKLEDDAQGKAGHGTFEVSDIRGKTNFYTEHSYLRELLSDYEGQSFDDVKKDVNKILKKENKLALKLVKSTDYKKIKNKDGSINQEALAKAFGKIEQEAMQKDSKYSKVSYQMALVTLLDEKFYVVNNKSNGGVMTYTLSDGSFISYVPGKSLTIKTSDGKTNSYDLDGEKLDEISQNGKSGINDAQYELENAQKHSEERTAFIAAKQANLDKCPVMNITVKNGNSMQGLVKDSFGFEVYDFADAQGNKLVGFGMHIADNTNLEFNEKGQLVKLEDPPGQGRRHFTFEYDERGNLISAIDKDGFGDITWQTKIVYDDQNRVVKETYGSPEKPDGPFIKEHKY